MKFGGRKLVLGLPDVEEIMPLAFFVLTQYRRVTDIRTDGQTERQTRCDPYNPRVKSEVNIRRFWAYISGIWGGIPWADWAQIFFGRRYPRRNHVIQIWWRSVQGFSVGWGSNFAISHWLRRSSLQHSHTTVWACDVLHFSWLCSHRVLMFTRINMN